VSGLKTGDDQLAELLKVDTEGWLAELPGIRKHFDRFGSRLPQGLREELQTLEQRLQGSGVAASR